MRKVSEIEFSSLEFLDLPKLYYLTTVPTKLTRKVGFRVGETVWIKRSAVSKINQLNSLTHGWVKGMIVRKVHEKVFEVRFNARNQIINVNKIRKFTGSDTNKFTNWSMFMIAELLRKNQDVAAKEEHPKGK